VIALTGLGDRYHPESVIVITGMRTLCALGHHHEIHFLWRPYLRDPKDELVLEEKRLKGEIQAEKVQAGNAHDYIKALQLFDDFYDWLIQNVQQNVARFSDAFERIAVVEGGVNGTAKFTRMCGDLLRKFQTGVVQFYALLFTGGITVIIYIMILR